MMSMPSGTFSLHEHSLPQEGNLTQSTPVDFVATLASSQGLPAVGRRIEKGRTENNPPPSLRATSSEGGQKLKLQNTSTPPPKRRHPSRGEFNSVHTRRLRRHPRRRGTENTVPESSPPPSPTVPPPPPPKAY